MSCLAAGWSLATLGSKQPLCEGRTMNISPVPLGPVDTLLASHSLLALSPRRWAYTSEAN